MSSETDATMDIDTRRQLLQRSIAALPLFEELSQRERDILQSVLTLHVVEDGEVLCREGEPGTSFFIVAKGTVEVYKELPQGRRDKLSEIGENNLIGQVALIDGKRRSATCLAHGRCVVLECSRSDFDRLFESGSTFAFKVVDQVVIDLAKRLREANQQLHDLYANPRDTLMRLHQAALDIQQTLAG